MRLDPNYSFRTTADGEDEFIPSPSNMHDLINPLKLASAPTGPNRESGVVAEFEHLVALFHFDGDDGRLATESDLGALHFNLVFCLDFHVADFLDTSWDRDGPRRFLYRC